jgi:hypothetical protein
VDLGNNKDLWIKHHMHYGGAGTLRCIASKYMRQKIFFKKNDMEDYSGNPVVN